MHFVGCQQAARTNHWRQLIVSMELCGFVGRIKNKSVMNGETEKVTMRNKIKTVSLGNKFTSIDVDSVRMSMILCFSSPILPVSNIEYKSSASFIQIRQIFSSNSADCWSWSIFKRKCVYNGKNYQSCLINLKKTLKYSQYLGLYAKFTNIYTTTQFMFTIRLQTGSWALY